jgi:putative toxin-antitoxin system antitoxin component (TIGR02293 family)
MAHRTPVLDIPDPEETSPDVAKFARFVRSGKAGRHSYVVFLGLEQFDSAGLLKAVERGMSFTSFMHLQRNLELPQSRLLSVLQIPQRTLSRRRKEGRMRPDESDRLLRAGRMFGRAVELFDGDAVAARRWLSSPQTILGGAIPWDLARSELGAREVEAAIGRVEHGVFS